MSDIVDSVHEKVRDNLELLDMPEFSIDAACCDTPHGVATTLQLRNLTGNQAGKRNWSGHALMSLVPWAEPGEQLDAVIEEAAYRVLPTIGFYRSDYDINLQGNNLNTY